MYHPPLKTLITFIACLFLSVHGNLVLAQGTDFFSTPQKKKVTPPKKVSKPKDLPKPVPKPKPKPKPKPVVTKKPDPKKVDLRRDLSARHLGVDGCLSAGT